MEKEYKNYYEILEIPISAMDNEVHDGYVRAKNAFTGDSVALYSLMTPHECERVLAQIEEAYSILSIPQKRKEYDLARGIKSSATGLTNSSSNQFQGNSVSETSGQKALKNRDSNMNTYPRSTSGDSPLPSQSASKVFKVSEDDFNIAKNEVEVSRIAAYKRFSLNFESNVDFEQEIENATSFTGELLRKIREYKKVDILRMADMTKISKTYIHHIENDEYQKLPALVYVRGFVYQYAKCLKLNPEIVATSYIHHVKSIKEAKEQK